MTHYLEFVNWDYKPNKSDLICLFRIEPAKGVSFNEAVGRVASESSNGTWTMTQYANKRHIKKLGAIAFERKGSFVKVAYPEDLFEKGNMPQILSSIAGNIFGMKAVANLRLEDIHFPPKIVKSFRGPQFGVKGVRKFMRIKSRPLTATVPKPKVGMTTKEHAYVGLQAWLGGVDFLKDDENLTSQVFNNFNKRVKLCMKYRDRAESITGEKKSYFLNITADTKTMEKRAKMVADYGNEYVMVDICTAGWAGLQTIRDVCKDYKLAIHAHRAFHAAFDRNPKHGMSMLTVAKCARLIGVDNIHIGTVLGKLVGSRKEVMNLNQEVEKQMVNEHGHVLGQNWLGVKPTIAVSSGGLHPGLVHPVMKMLGHDIVIQCGGGLHGHPSGPLAGARALRQSIDAVMMGDSLKKYSKTHLELKSALEHWGYMKPI